MNERNETAQPDQDTSPMSMNADTDGDSPLYARRGSEGWALQWDTTALRKANLARKMRDLRQSPTDQ
ncbi:hypothetical protein IH601_10800 [Candidatus Bipolaricaulota bacterium]|jgi:hypothetical protein|nr:hypothetical protein [Candidatus Bipolaricaulota bacterium]